jgi:predicted DCC family thiol-disulfide oxidoreductase YuxK
MVGADRLDIRSFQRPEVLASYPGVSHDACMKSMHVVLPDGRVFRAAEAIVRALVFVPVLGVFAFVYYVPLVRQLVDLGYWLIAKNRYRILGRTDRCEVGGTCHLH